jgi:hypothetical protein
VTTIIALLAAAFTLGVLAGLALAVFLSTAAEHRWFSCLWGRLRVKAPAPMPLQEAWMGQKQEQLRRDWNSVHDSPCTPEVRLSIYGEWLLTYSAPPTVDQWEAWRKAA